MVQYGSMSYIPYSATFTLAPRPLAAAGLIGRYTDFTRTVAGVSVCPYRLLILRKSRQIPLFFFKRHRVAIQTTSARLICISTPQTETQSRSPFVIVFVPAAQRELIHTEHPHPTDRRIRQPTDQPQQRRPAHRHAQHGGQPRSGPPRQGQPNCHQCTVQADAAALVVLGQPRDLLDESACAAVAVVAEEPARRQPHHRRTPRDGKIRHVPPVAAVHSRRHRPHRRPRDPLVCGCAWTTTTPSA